eukprot:7256017-Alexandrium_andersonii.AAC.1
MSGKKTYCQMVNKTPTTQQEPAESAGSHAAKSAGQCVRSLEKNTGGGRVRARDATRQALLETA